MAYIVLGESEEANSEAICNRLMSLSGETTLLYCCQAEATVRDVNTPTQWLGVKDAIECSILCAKCGADDTHRALDALALQHREITPTILWYFQPFHSDDNELLGALLRATRCLNSRILVVSKATDIEQRLNNLWISDYIFPVIIKHIESLSLPCWRGQLLMGEDRHVYVEITDNSVRNDTQLACKTEVLKGASMELVSDVDLSSIHACMLGHTYTLTTASTTNSLQHSLHTGYIVRMVIPQQTPTAPSLQVPTTAAAPHSIKAEEITSTGQWLSYVIKEKLSNPEVMPNGPVYYQYYLLYSSNPGHADTSYICCQFDTDDLSELLLSVYDINCCRRPEVDITSVYNELRERPLSPSSLCAEAEQIHRMISSLLHEGDKIDHVSGPQMCNEYLALEERTNRRLTLLRADDSADRKGAKTSDSGCTLTLESLKKHFTMDGVAIDPKYRLKTGNFEEEGLRQHKWPLATLHYGPGIHYHTEDDISKLSDPRLAIYRTKHGFPETASLYTADVVSVNNTVLSSKKRSTTRTDSADTKSAETIKVVKKRRSPLKRTSPALHPPKTQQTACKSVKVSAEVQPAAANSTKAVASVSNGAYSNTREERAQRNKRNVQKMKRAVDRALAKKGIKREHKLYEAYARELFDLSMRGVKELKTSHGLEKKMKEIAEVYAPAAVMTVNMKSR